ncbi:MAG: GtrA family protein [Clostridia bacterium]|nr:GtrA family protein [Clostridia bacterium]
MKLKELLKTEKFAAFIQFVKFCIVGVSNTLISYGIDMLCFYVLFGFLDFQGAVNLLSKIGLTASADTVKTVIASILAFVISVTNSYFWNNRFVFKAGNSTFKDHLKSYFKTFLCYGVTGLIISPVIKVLLVNASIPYAIASFGSLIVTIPINFILNKFWAFKKQ